MKKLHQKIKRLRDWARSILSRMVEKRVLTVNMPDGTVRTFHMAGHPRDCPETELLYYFLLDKADLREGDIND